MKKLFLFLIMMVVFLIPSLAQEAEVAIEAVKSSFWLDLITENWEVISVLVIWLVNRIVPTKWRDPILTVVTWLLSLIPDKKTGGGKH